MNYGIEDLKNEVEGTLHNVNSLLSNNSYLPRELALVKTKLQEALLWASLVDPVNSNV